MDIERLSINEQAVEAARIVDNLFNGAATPIPEKATLQSLWEEVCRLKGNSKKPKKVEAIRLLLENPLLTGLSIPLIADIIKRVYHRRGVTCDTSDSSIRWYISQKTLEWDIKPRDKRGADLDISSL